MAKAAIATAPEPALESDLNLFINDKGGVGKSTVSSAKADLYRDEENENAPVVHIYDTDGSNGSMLKRIGTKDANGNVNRDQDPAKGSGWFALDMDGSRDTFLNALDVSPRPRVIMMDMGAKALEQLKKIVDNGEGVDGLISAINGQGFNINLFHVVSNLQESTASVRAYLNAFGDRARHVAVINKGFGLKLGDLNKPSNAQTKWGETDFPFWFGHSDPETGERKGYKTRDELLALGGKEIAFPALAPAIYARLAATNLPYREAAKSKRFTLAERSNLGKFNSDAKAAFDQVKEYTGL